MPEEKQKLCFVIMPFSKERSDIYKHGIAPACKKAGFQAVRLDKLRGPINFNREIVEHIFNSDVIIAEITDENPNVYYELGVAHAFGSKTIMIAQNSQDLPSDIRSYRCMIYSQSDLTQLQKEIIAELRKLEKWSQNSSNPVQDFMPAGAFIPKSAWEQLNREMQKKEELLCDSVPKAEWEKLQQQKQNLQNELRAQEQLLAQQTAENVRLEQELQRLHLPPAAPSQPESSKSESWPRLRSQPVDNLSGEDVKAMLKKHDFYCREYKWSKDWSNPQGRGINDDFEPQQNREVVVDRATGLTWQQSGSPDCLTYADAEKFIHDLRKQGFAGYNDWRLPTLEEAMSLMKPEEKDGGLYVDPAFAKTQEAIWTSDKNKAGATWVVRFNAGYCVHGGVGNGNYYVRAVC